MVNIMLIDRDIYDINGDVDVKSIDSVLRRRRAARWPEILAPFVQPTETWGICHLR